MGTTMTVALVEDGQVAFGHVGDSRAYLLRDGAMEQLTEDHSLVAELMRSGKLSPEEAESHPQRSVITRALGTDPDVDVDTFTIEARDRRRLPALLRRPDDDGRRTEPSSTLVERAPRRPGRGAARARAGGEPRRRRGQHHRGRLRDRGRAAAHDGETREHVLAGASPDDEDTLTEADAVPAVDTAVISAEEIQAELKATERRERAVRRRHLRRGPRLARAAPDRRGHSVGALSGVRTLRLSMRNRELAFLDRRRAS